MGKAVLVMEMPERCRDCKWIEHVLKFCGISEEFMNDDSIRQAWCPLRPLPEPKSEEFGQTIIASARAEGWNNCLHTIIEDLEEAKE